MKWFKFLANALDEGPECLFARLETRHPIMSALLMIGLLALIYGTSITIWGYFMYPTKHEPIDTVLMLIVPFLITVGILSLIFCLAFCKARRRGLV